MSLRGLCCLLSVGATFALRRSTRRVEDTSLAEEQGHTGVAKPEADIQYYYVANHSTIVTNKPECNFYEAEDVGRKVSDECCDVSAWPDGSGMSTHGPDARTGVNDDSGEQFSCYARERTGPNAGTYVRNFFGCYQGAIMAAEGCAPPGTSMGHGYPLPSQEQAIAASEDGDPVSCGCDKPWYNQGPGCYVALSGYSAGVSPDPTANFLKVVGANACHSQQSVSITSSSYVEKAVVSIDDAPQQPSVAQDTYTPNLFMYVMAGIYGAAGIGLGLQAWFAPGGSLLATGTFARKLPDGTKDRAYEQTPNATAWGSRNMGIVIPCVMCFFYPSNKVVWLVAFLTQCFRDIPDTVTGIAQNGITPMYIAFGIMAIIDVVLSVMLLL